MAAAACSCEMSFGRSFKPRVPMAEAIAPDETKTDSIFFFRASAIDLITSENTFLSSLKEGVVST
jgi:hypothetical protein